jgi:oxalate decarboxylase
MHWHPNAAERQYDLKGAGHMTVFGSGGRARTDSFGPGNVGHVPLVLDIDASVFAGFPNGERRIP